MAGRPPKPTALKLIEGNRGKRATNAAEPDPEYLQDLTPAEHMTDGAKAVWEQLAPQLRRTRLLTVVDVPALEFGCEAIAMYRYASRRASGELVYGKAVADSATGEPRERGEQINPWLVVQSMSFKQAMAVLREFGATPAARARVAVNPQADLFPAEDRAAGYF